MVRVGTCTPAADPYGFVALLHTFKKTPVKNTKQKKNAMKSIEAAVERFKAQTIPQDKTKKSEVKKEEFLLDDIIDLEADNDKQEVFPSPVNKQCQQLEGIGLDTLKSWMKAYIHVAMREELKQLWERHSLADALREQIYDDLMCMYNDRSQAPDPEHQFYFHLHKSGSDGEV